MKNGESDNPENKEKTTLKDIFLKTDLHGLPDLFDIGGKLDR